MFRVLFTTVITIAVAYLFLLAFWSETAPTARYAAMPSGRSPLPAFGA